MNIRVRVHGTQERVSWNSEDGSGSVDLPTEEFGGDNSPTIEFHGRMDEIERRQAVRSRSVPRRVVAQESAMRRIEREGGIITA